MRNYLTFGGVDSRSYGVFISGSGIFDSPTREYEMISIPGRDGALIGMEKRFGNISVTYPAFIASDYLNNIVDLKSAFLSKVGYQVLTDSYYPEEFRKAAFAGDIRVDTVGLMAGKFNITFNCKPQRYLVSGEETTTLTAAGSVTNPTMFESKPKIVVTGYGTLWIGSQGIEIADVWPSVTIDSEMADCYYGVNNANPQVVFANNDFPVLVPGTNNISFDGTITKLEIVPRWWRI